MPNAECIIKIDGESMKSIGTPAYGEEWLSSMTSPVWRQRCHQKQSTPCNHSINTLYSMGEMKLIRKKRILHIYFFRVSIINLIYQEKVLNTIINPNEKKKIERKKLRRKKRKLKLNLNSDNPIVKIKERKKTRNFSFKFNSSAHYHKF